MNSIISFFNSIAQFLVSCYEIFKGFISDFLDFLTLGHRLGYWLGNLISFLPPDLLALAMMLFACVIFYKVLGREG